MPSEMNGNTDVGIKAKALDSLLSDASVEFLPQATKSETGEAVTELVLMGHSVWNRDPRQPLTGFDTLRYRELLANPVVDTALQVILDFAFWLDGGYQANNDPIKNPGFADLDAQYIDYFNRTELEWDSASNSQDESYIDLAQYAMSYGFGLGEDAWEPNRDNEWQQYAIKTFESYNFDPRIDKYHNLECIFQYGTFKSWEPDRFTFGTWPRRVGSNVLGKSELYSLVETISHLSETEWALLKATQRNAERPYLHTFAIDKAGKDTSEVRIAKIDKAVSENARVLHLPGLWDDKGKKLLPLDEIKPFEDRTTGTIMEVAKDRADTGGKRITRRFSIPDDYGLNNITFGAYKKLVQSSTLTSARVFRVQQWVRKLRNNNMKKAFAYNNFLIPKGYRIPSWEWSMGEEDWDLQKIEAWNKLAEGKWVDPSEEAVNQQVRRQFKIAPKGLKTSDSSATGLRS